MKKFPGFIVFGIVPLIAWGLGVSYASTLPAEITVQYDLSRNGSAMVEISEQFRHGNGRYRIDSEAKGKGFLALSNRGSIRRSSEGEIVAGGLRPTEFRDRRGNGPVSAAKFDWPGKRIVHEFDGRTETTDLKGGSTQDRLSFLWEFAFRSIPERNIAVLLADGKGASQVRYRVVGREKLDTPVGVLDTLHIAKEQDAGDERGTEIWFAVQKNNLPVRLLVIEKDGTRLDQIVTRILP